jgi:hypothetical protein
MLLAIYEVLVCEYLCAILTSPSPSVGGGGAVIGGTLFKKICLQNQPSLHLLQNSHLLAQRLIRVDRLFRILSTSFWLLSSYKYYHK